MIILLMKKNQIWGTLFWILVFIHISFIFRNSLTIADSSQKISYSVSYTILRYLSYFSLYTSNIRRFDYFVRKLAHFSEFALLGILVLCAIRRTTPRFYAYQIHLTFLLFVPITDEIIQLFVPGRACQISDVFIDISGYLFGSFIALTLFHLISDIKNLIKA